MRWKRTEKRVVSKEVDEWLEFSKKDIEWLKTLMKGTIEYPGFDTIIVESITINHKASYTELPGSEEPGHLTSRSETYTLRKPIKLK